MLRTLRHAGAASVPWPQRWQLLGAQQPGPRCSSAHLSSLPTITASSCFRCLTCTWVDVQDPGKLWLHWPMYVPAACVGFVTLIDCACSLGQHAPPDEPRHCSQSLLTARCGLAIPFHVSLQTPCFCVLGCKRNFLSPCVSCAVAPFRSDNPGGGVIVVSNDNGRTCKPGGNKDGGASVTARRAVPAGQSLFCSSR